MKIFLIAFGSVFLLCLIYEIFIASAKEVTKKGGRIKKILLVFICLISVVTFFYLINNKPKIKPSLNQSHPVRENINKEEPTQKFVSQEFNFSILFPEGWIIKEPISNSSIIIKAINRMPDSRFATLNIYLWEIDNPEFYKRMSPEEFYNSLNAEGAILISSGKEDINNSQAVWIEMENSDKSLYVIGYAILKDNLLYWLYGNTILGGREWFETNKEPIVSSIRTFKFLN